VPRFNEIINNFINGEVSPKLYGRMDTEIYKRSCRAMENMVVFPQGGAGRRIGTEIILDHSLKSDASGSTAFSTAARIIPFIFSKDESYIIIFHGAVATVGGNYFVTIYHPKTGKISQPFFSGGATAGFPLDSIGAGSSSANTLSTDAVLKELQYAQNGDTIYFSHQDCPPFFIKRLSEGAFYTADFYNPYDSFVGLTYSTAGDEQWKKWPFSPLNRTTTTFTMTATTGTTVVTASSAVFTAGLVGSLFYITDNGVTGVGRFTGLTSTTVMDCVVYKTMPSTSAIKTWGLSAWSYVNGYPRSVSFMGNRLVWGFTKKEPEKVWFSQAFDFTELSNARTLTPGSDISKEDPGKVTISSTEANAGMWLRGSTGELLVGTRGREYAISGLTGTLEEISVKPQTSYGSESVQPALVDDVPVFVQRGFKKLREMLFDFRSSGYTANDVTFLAEHIFKKSQQDLGDLYVSQIKQLAYQPVPSNILWAIDNNGYLYGCTKSRENAVTAFHRHELGGLFSTQPAYVQSIAAIPSANGSGDDLYLLVKRTVNAATVVYLERLTKEFEGTTLHSDLSTRENQPIFSDCAKIFRPVSAQFWAPLRTAATATVAGGSTTGATTGTVNYTSKFWQATANTSYTDYDGTSNADVAQVGCIKFKMHKFALTVTAALQTIFTICKAAGDDDNLIKLQISGVADATYGNVILTIKDSGGTAIINAVTLGNLLTAYPGVLELE